MFLAPVSNTVPGLKQGVNEDSNECWKSTSYGLAGPLEGESPELS